MWNVPRESWNFHFKQKHAVYYPAPFSPGPTMTAIYLTCKLITVFWQRNHCEVLQPWVADGPHVTWVSGPWLVSGRHVTWPPASWLEGIGHVTGSPQAHVVIKCEIIINICNLLYLLISAGRESTLDPGELGVVRLEATRYVGWHHIILYVYGKRSYLRQSSCYNGSC